MAGVALPEDVERLGAAPCAFAQVPPALRSCRASAAAPKPPAGLCRRGQRCCGLGLAALQESVRGEGNRTPVAALLCPQGSGAALSFVLLSQILQSTASTWALFPRPQVPPAAEGTGI